MAKINITVRAPGLQEKSYLFDGRDIVIGRSEHCDLSICHEAVPRELCRAWVLEDGRTVRLEERPGGTNPITTRGRAIRGGIAGEVLQVEVGPVSICLVSVGDNAVVSGRKAKGRKRVAALFASAGVLLILLAMMGSPEAENGSKTMVEKLPETHLLKASYNMEIQGADPVVTAKRLAERADEILNRSKVTPSSRMEAAAMYESAGSLLNRAGEVRKAKAISSKARLIRKELALEYKSEVLRLKAGSRLGDDEEVAEAASSLLSFLPGLDPSMAMWLEQHAQQTEERGDTVIRCASALAIGALFVIGCGAREKSPPETGNNELPALELARALSEAGDHLNASRYLELAYNQGADEGEILPMLAAEQVRSGRLLAALHTTKRLRELYPQREELAALQELIRELIGLEVDSSRKETKP